MHKQDLKAEDEEFKVFRHLVKTNRINHKENFDFKKWNDRMYLKIIPDIKRLCTGTETKSDVFKCHLHYKTNPFLRLSPFKVEIFHNDPVVAVVHDFVSEKESNWVKSHARGRMRAATYFQKKKSTLGEDDKETVRIDFSSDRTSKTRFVADSAGKTVKTISERISFATEWNLGNNTDVLTNLGPDYWASENMYSENFRVMNYAPGGWVSPHIDTGGDGISSFMLYLSSGVVGGYTIFPMINLAVKPKPNAAIVWYGRDLIGSADIRSLHLGCPVVSGNKWAALKLIQTRGQWDRAPCRQDSPLGSIPLFSR